MQQTPLYSSKDTKRRGGGKSQAARPAAFSFSCLVLDKFAAAAENLPSTPTEQHQSKTATRRPPKNRHPDILQTNTDDDSSLNLPGSVVSLASSAADSDANASGGGRRLHLRKTLRQQEITSGANTMPHTQQSQQHPWEATTKTIQQEAMRALQCQPREDDNMTLRTGGDETNTSMQAIFPDDLSDYELGTIMEDQDADDDYKTSIHKSMTGATGASSQLSQVSPDDLKELVQAASSAVDTLERKLVRCRRISLCLLALLVVVAVLAVTLGVGLVGKKELQGAAAAAANNGKSPTERPLSLNETDQDSESDTDFEPTASPTAAAEASLDILREQYLPSYTLEALNELQSPQSQAWQWLEWQTEQLKMNSIATADSLLTRFVLATLYYSSGEASWTKNTTWLGLESECEWYNEATQPCVNGILTDLSLPNNNLAGAVPREIELLTFLVKLDLSFNQGLTLPENISAMTRLQQLELPQLGLSALPKLPTCLERLNLRDNALQRIPYQIANITSLRNLLLGGNLFQSQVIPTFLASLTNLTYLSIENSQLSGVIPTDLGRLTNLEYLVLEENSLVGTVPSQLDGLSNLKLMTLHQNMLTGSVPASMCMLKAEVSMFMSVDCDAVQCDCGCGCGL